MIHLPPHDSLSVHRPPSMRDAHPLSVDSTSPDELTAKIANGVHQFSAMLAHMTATNPVARGRAPYHGRASISSITSCVSLSSDNTLTTVSTNSQSHDYADPYVGITQPQTRRSHGEPTWDATDRKENQTDEFTPLMCAAWCGQAQRVKELLESGVNVDLQDQAGWTALIWGASLGHVTVVQVLLDHNASKELQTHHGRTVFDFVNAKNKPMVRLLPARQRAGAIPTMKTPTDIQRRRSMAVSEAMGETDFYLDQAVDGYTHFMTRELEMHRKQSLDAAIQAYDNTDDDMARWEASLASICTFVWDKCLPDQMLVFCHDDIGRIVDTITMVEAKLPAEPMDEVWGPATVIFFCCRFAHYHASRELLNALLTAVVAKVSKVLRTARGIEQVAYWISNLCQLSSYLRKDTLVLTSVTTSSRQQIACMISEACPLLASDCEQRIDMILESCMLKHDTIQTLDNIEFEEEDGWSEYIAEQGRRVRRSIQIQRWSLDSSSDDMDIHRYEGNTNGCERYTPENALSPRTLVRLLSSAQNVMQSFCIPQPIITQTMIRCCRFIACQTFNFVLTHRRYLCRSKALQLHMNISVIEEWVHETKLPATLHDSFRPLIQLARLLQCLSGLDNEDVFQDTIHTFDTLNALQVNQCVTRYRYEVSEPRLPEAIVRLANEAAEQVLQNRDGTRRTSNPDILLAPKERDMMQSGSEHDSGGKEAWSAEKYDPKYRLPFSLPQTAPEEQPALDSSWSASDALCETIRQRCSKARGTGYFPCVSGNWLARLDDKKAKIAKRIM